MSAAEIDWWAAIRVAERLGAHTRDLVAERDAPAVLEWSLQMARQYFDSSSANGPRGLSYMELPVLMGHGVEEPPVETFSETDDDGDEDEENEPEEEVES
jgi:hypothetical protein